MLDLLPTLPSDDSAPRHKRVQSVLHDLVTSGRLRPGDKIAAEVQIASALGVSKMTVNKALLALTAHGVFVREVGRGTFVAEPKPRPLLPGNPHLSSLLQIKSRTIAVSFVNGGKNIADTDYYWNLYQGISEAFAEAPHIAVQITPTGVSDYAAEQERAPVDGRIVVAPRHVSVNSLNVLWQAGHPVAVLGAAWPDFATPCVDSDNQKGAQAAVSHLIRLGHKRIALLYAEPDTGNTQDRLAGYRTTLQTANLPSPSIFEVQAASFLRMGDAAHAQLNRLFSSENPVTAVFAAGYYLSLEAMNAARGAGLRVPDDISIVGFDDPLSAQWAYPPLTTVRQSLPAMGKRAGDILLAQLQYPDQRGDTETQKTEIFPAELVVRGSTAAAPAVPPSTARLL